MTATQTKLRRGTSTQCESMTPTEAEVIVDLSNDRLRLGDSVMSGGIPLPNAYDMMTNVFGFIVAGGTANAITGTLSPAIAAYTQPLAIKIKIANTNTGAVTLNLNSLGTRSIVKISGGTISALVAGDLVAGGIYEVVYDGTQFIVLGAMGGLIEVGQGQLKTSTGSVSTSSSVRVNLALPGGQYGFYPVLSASSSLGYIGLCSATMLEGSGSGSGFSNISYISLTADPASPGSPTTLSALQRFVTSSPPYDLGDGDVGGFIFVLVNSAGDVVSHYAADAPPWAYNGPTNICADYQCPISGKKFRKVRDSKTRGLDSVMNGRSSTKYKLEEITHEVKNRDMGLIRSGKFLAAIMLFY
jgi:hypothetical protein